MVFQLFFAAVTITIVTSATAERLNFLRISFSALSGSRLSIVRSPTGHGAAGGPADGTDRFCRGTAVEICSGFAALALATCDRTPAGFGEHALEPHNIPIALLGAALLWFWLVGSTRKCPGTQRSAVTAFVNTNPLLLPGALAWMFASWYRASRVRWEW